MVKIILFFGLPFVPAEQIEDIFADILMPEAVPDPEVQAFADYMFETYIGPDARFPPQLWAAPPIDGNIRTPNGAESFHRHTKDIVGNAHPNVFQLTNILLNIQEETYIKIQSVGESRRRTQDISVLTLSYNMYRDGVFSARDYLKRICFKFLPVQ